MIIYKKTKRMYFMIKEEKMLDKYVRIWEKFSNIIKKIIIVNFYIIRNI